MASKPELHCSLMSPSKAEILINCKASAVFSKGIPNESTIYSLFGSQCHLYSSNLINKYLGRPIDEPNPDLSLFDKEMEEIAEGYLQYFKEIYEQLKASGHEVEVLVEEPVGTDKFGKDAYFGTTDLAIIDKTDKRLIIIDLKSGITPVKSDSPQVRSYAYLTLETFKDRYPHIKEVTMCIFQPRICNTSETTIKSSELYAWVDEVIRPTIEQLLAGSTEAKAGKHCKFCSCRFKCSVLRDYNLKLYSSSEHKEGILMNDDELEEILSKADEAIHYFNSIKDYALSEAIKGHVFPNFKLVEGKSFRQFTDEKAVADILTSSGFEPYEKKLKTITTLTREVGNKELYRILGSYISKTPAKLTLVSRDDKRPEITSAEADFKNLDA